ncbi:MAG: hypothetical protein AAF702_49825, partial [Chloroflexota bacterium]
VPESCQEQFTAKSLRISLIFRQFKPKSAQKSGEFYVFRTWQLRVTAPFSNGAEYRRQLTNEFFDCIPS